MADFSNNIEAEIAELSQKIAEKRKILENSKGIVEERDLVKTALQEHISSIPPSSTGQTASSSSVQKTATATDISGGKSYLDFLDEESRNIVDSLVEAVFSKGMREATKALELHEPFIIDAFHDVLTDKLYEELRKRGIVK